MKKVVALILTISLIAALAIVFTSCSTYTSEEGTIDEIVGTYKLTKFQCKDENDESVDMLSTYNIEAYIAIKSDGYGYYAYKEGDAEYWCDSIKITFNHDADNQDLYDAIEYTRGTDIKLAEKRPGAQEEPKMGVNVSKHTLNYYVPDYEYTSDKLHIEIHSESVLYERVNSDASLEAIEKATGKDFDEPAQFELKKLNGVYVYQCSEKSINAGTYIYYVAEFDSSKMTYKSYYKFVGGSGGESSGDLVFNKSKANAEENIVGDLEIGSEPTWFNIQFPITATKTPSVSCLNKYSSEVDEEGNTTYTYDRFDYIYLMEGTSIADYCAQLEQDYNNAHQA